MVRKYKNSLVLFLVFLLTGCATAIRPDKLQTPNKITCIQLSEPISYKEVRGLMSVEWEYRLERGSYISEKEDDEGTYFRAPPGGVYIGRPDMKDKPPGILSHMVRDGGFWIPHDLTKQPKMYNYFSTSDSAVVVSDANTTCSSFAYFKDPNTSKVSVAAFATGGAVGGVLGRAMVPNSQMSYGQAAVGGAIGGAIVAGLINMDVGKIIPWDISDQSFIDKLMVLAGSAIPLQKIENSATQEAQRSP